MNLTFEVKGNGYVILNNDITWIVQEGYFPYQGATLEESAQNHIDALIEEQNNAAEQENKMQALEDRLTLTEEMLMEMMLNGVNE